MSHSIPARADLGTNASPRGRSASFVTATAAVSGTTLLAFALAERLFVGTSAVILIATLLLPPSVLVAAIAVAAKRIAGAFGPRLGAVWTPRVAGAFIAFAVFFVGGALSNTLLVDTPTERWTLAGYALSGIVAAIVFGVLHRASETPPARRAIARRWRALLAAVCLAAGVGATCADACCFPHAFPLAHLGALALALGGFTVASIVAGETCLFEARIRRSLRVVGLLVPVVLVSGALVTVRRAGLEPLARAASGGRTFLVTVRGLFDHDGDGFSARFGGADCDDHDPLAYPLSTVGRDCLGIVSNADVAPATVVAPAAPPDANAAAPKIMLFVTIDAFRCGFARGERPDLTNACPNLTALGDEGRLQDHAYARAPHTLGSISSILAHRGESGVEPLPATLRTHGYRTEAIATHRALLNIPRLRESFDVADESLAPLAQSSWATTSEDVTDRILTRVEEAARSESRTFLWAHYYDAHSPYVQTPGSHWVWSHLDAYAAEIKRTDEAIGRLVSSLRRIVPDDALAMFVTADHGEELGEHGGTDHGRTLYEEVVKVPFLAWRTGADPRRGLPDALPAGDIDMAPYVLSVATGSSFTPSEALLMKAAPPNDAQVGVVRGDLKYIVHSQLGYEELFDLRADPHEQHDVSAENAGEVASLRRVLGDLLRDEQRSPTTL